MPRTADYSLMEAESFLVIKFMAKGQNLAGDCDTKYLLFKYTAT
jgi:hypothetical protein